MPDGRVPVGRLRQPVAVAMHVADEPRPDVAAAGHGREIVHLPKHVEFLEPLKDAECERGAANAAAGNSQADELCFVLACPDSTAPSHVSGTIGSWPPSLTL